MTVIYAAGVAVLALVCATGHSALGERRVFGPLYREEQSGLFAVRSTRDVVRAVWHLPSVAWVALGLAVLAARLAGDGEPLLSLVAAVVFGVSGMANLIALRKPHFGGLLLLGLAGLTAADWYLAA